MAQAMKLNVQQVTEIRASVRNFGYLKRFARRFNCSINTIQRAKKRLDSYGRI
jgi:phage host-nuclease inhibitor protein Gam